MMIVGDATTCSVTSDNSRGVIYDRNFFIRQVTFLNIFVYSDLKDLAHTEDQGHIP